jgi:AcrR family transcriptional regulator
MNVIHSAARIRPASAIRRDAAIAAAREVIRTEGLRALNARRVALAIGVSVGTLYNLFADFDAIVLAVNQGTLEALESALADTAAPDTAPEAALAALVACTLRFAEEHRRLWTAVLEFGAASPDRQQAALAPAISRLVDHFDAALRPLWPAPGQAGLRRMVAATCWAGLDGIGALVSRGQLSAAAPGVAAPALAGLLLVGLLGLARPPAG